MWQPRLSKLDFYRRGYLVRNQHWDELPLCLSSTRYPALVQSRGSLQAPAVGYYWPNSPTSNSLYCTVGSGPLTNIVCPAHPGTRTILLSIQYNRFMVHVPIVGTLQRGTISRHGASRFFENSPRKSLSHYPRWMRQPNCIHNATGTDT